MTTFEVWTQNLRSIPKGVWALGFVSMLMDISSEMIHALLPIYMVTVLGTSTLAVGVIEGIAEATAAITKIFSGALSDWLGSRRGSQSWATAWQLSPSPCSRWRRTCRWLIAARFIDRIGKGVRGAPRDALVADISPPERRGASFGLRQSLDTIGAFLGPLIAIGLMLLTTNSFTTVFWIAVIPGFLAFALMAFAVQEPSRPPHLRHVKSPSAVLSSPASGAITGGWSRSQRYSRWHVSAKPSSFCGRNLSDCRSRLRRPSWCS